MPKIQRALLSVYAKEGLPELAKELQRYGVHLLSSGGTATLLKQQDIPVTAVSDYTGAPEILDGRVKTLHPKISGGILARATADHQRELEEHGIERIDMVVVNLYPFQKTAAKPGATEEEIVEMIDIGGPTLIRAAAKNHERVVVVVDPADYGLIIEEMDRHEGMVGEKLRRELAAKAFAHTAAYDSAISNYFYKAEEEPFPEVLSLQLKRVQRLRYGENPHQRAALYLNPYGALKPAIVDCEQLHGKELSHNNILDADAALSLILELPETAVGIIKHTNPCGAATSSKSVVEAFLKAKATDPVSAFGGIVACNRPVTAELASELKEMFLEAVIAPAFDPAGLALLAKKKNLRLLRYLPQDYPRTGVQMRSVAGGMLVQDWDGAVEDLNNGRVVSRRAPTPEEVKALNFAWRVCKHVKSNAIVFALADQLVGVGAGQMSRVDSVRIAVSKAQLPLRGTVLASDAFFPFRDGVDEAANAGATAIVQPGGSIRDEEVIAAADEHGLAMIFTGVRHFRH